MNKYMYFIPILSRALKSTDREKALTQAINQIVSLGNNPDYADGYFQFLQFTRIAKKTKAIDPIKLIVQKEGKAIASITLNRPMFTKRLPNITPGVYTAELSTGRLLWEERLSVKDLILALAHPHSEFRLAAKTEDEPQHPTREVKLFKGRLTLRVFPSIECGWIEIRAENLL